MKRDLIEIRWCGRGGQGAVTAANIFAEAAMSEGKFIQAFPEYGPERMGAPVMSYTRISLKPLTIHCQVASPDISALLDPTLLCMVDVTEGVDKNGIIVVNTKDTPAALRRKMAIEGRKIFTVDASGISAKTLGRNMPNMPTLAAVVKASGLVKLDSVIRNFQQEFSAKFKPEVVKANLDTI